MPQQGGYETVLHEYFTWLSMNDHKYKMGDTPLKAYQYWSRQIVAETGTNPTLVPRRRAWVTCLRGLQAPAKLAQTL